jgi:hypothetical protein
MYATSRLLTSLNPSSSDLSKSRKKGKENLNRLKSLKASGSAGGGPGKVQIDWEAALENLNEYEEAMLNEVVSPGEIEVGFDGPSPLSSQLESSGRVKADLLSFVGLFSLQLSPVSIRRSRPSRRPSSSLSSTRTFTRLQGPTCCRLPRECCCTDRPDAGRRCWRRRWPGRAERRL